MRRFSTVLATLVLAATGLIALPASAQADDSPCTITNFSPRSVVVGRSPKVVTFNVTATGCSLEYWNVRGGDYDFYVYKDSPQHVFDPYRNSADTKPKDVVVEASNADYDSRSRVFADAFTVKRYTGWDQFNASPEPVTKGKTITIKGRLRITNWELDRYDPYTNRTVSVEFRTANGTYKQVKTAKTGTGGYLTTTVKATTDGYWRLRYGGNSYAGAATVAGDFVDVR